MVLTGAAGLRSVENIMTYPDMTAVIGALTIEFFSAFCRDLPRWRGMACIFTVGLVPQNSHILVGVRFIIAEMRFQSSG